MIESLPAWVGDGLAPWTIVTIVFLMLVTGKLHTNVSYQTLKEQKNYWREAAEELRETTHIQARTIEKQEVTGDTVRRVMEAVQEANRRDGGDT